MICHICGVAVRCGLGKPFFIGSGFLYPPIKKYSVGVECVIKVDWSLELWRGTSRGIKGETGEQTGEQNNF